MFTASLDGGGAADGPLLAAHAPRRNFSTGSVFLETWGVLPPSRSSGGGVPAQDSPGKKGEEILLCLSLHSVCCAQIETLQSHCNPSLPYLLFYISCEHLTLRDQHKSVRRRRVIAGFKRNRGIFVVERGVVVRFACSEMLLHRGIPVFMLKAAATEVYLRHVQLETGKHLSLWVL